MTHQPRLTNYHVNYYKLDVLPWYYISWVNLLLINWVSLGYYLLVFDNIINQFLKMFSCFKFMTLNLEV